jgi:hypothetical protein
MTFNVIASNQFTNQSGTLSSRTHSLTGSFLKDDIAIVLTMPNSDSLASGTNYGAPAGWTRVHNDASTTNTIYYAYYILPANQTNFSTTFTSDYGSFCMIVRGYTIKEGYVGTLPITRTLLNGSVILLPGGTGQTGFIQQGIGYDSTAQYSGAYREITSAGSYSIPTVTQYSTAAANLTTLILDPHVNSVPNAPTGLTATSAVVGSNLTVNWTHNDPDSDPQSQYQIRYCKVT